MRNEFRDRLADYYKTNRKISEESSKNEASEKGEPFSTREKTMVIVLCILVVLLAIKYIIW